MGLATSIKAAKRMVESQEPEVWDVLEEVIAEHPVLLNRAPTLHRLGIQAFEPILVEGKAIQVHPLVCHAFNADFDGDQMAVHLPLSAEAQAEARILMLSSNNILSPAHGRALATPTQDMVLGGYYLTYSERDLAKSTAQELAKELEVPGISRFRSEEEVEFAVEAKQVGLQEPIEYRWDGELILTTPGRVIFNSEVERSLAGAVGDGDASRHSFINRTLSKKEMGDFISELVDRYGAHAIASVLDTIKSLGFRYATQAGVTISKNDIIVPPEKEDILASFEERVSKVEQQYARGLITEEERHEIIVNLWTEATDAVADVTEKALFELNPIYMMANSGARGSFTQIRQLAGMRGLMANPKGEIIERPIKASFMEGLTVLEYFISTHGARKGLADTALRTADSGYLTRRPVDVAQDCIITLEDCGTSSGIKVRAIIDAGTVVASLASRILGRTTAEDVRNPSSHEIIVKSGTLLEEPQVEAIVAAGVQELRIRSVLTCETSAGVCGKCYGRDLARGTPVNMGEAVGVIAAQSIGEPGTQLTMRTFHIGGAAQISEQSVIESNFDGTIKIKNKNVVKNSDGQTVAMARNMVIAVVDPDGTERAVHRIQYGARVLGDDGDKIRRGQRIAEWDPYTRPILTEVEGTVGFEDLVEGQSMSETLDESTGIAKRVVTDWRATRGVDLHPAIVVKDKQTKLMKLARGGEARYQLAVDAIISVEPGTHVKAGDVMARIPTESAKTRDITGGLPRVAELFEARRPKEAAIIAEISGTIRFGRDYKNKRRVIIEPSAKDEEQKEYLIPKGKHIHLQDGDFVEKGDFIVEGNPAPHDILAIKGVEELAAYLVNEIQDVYRLQGVAINDKHIEVIVRQMLQKVEVQDAGETELIEGEQIDKV